MNDQNKVNSQPAAAALHLDTTHLRLRPDASIETLAVDEHFWPRLMNGELGTFHNEYLVTSLHFDTVWATWEVHPMGDEIVILLHGDVEFIMESPEGVQGVRLSQSGQFVFVPRGIWHTCKVHKSTSMLFITAGEGTMGRPVDA